MPSSYKYSMMGWECSLASLPCPQGRSYLMISVCRVRIQPSFTPMITGKKLPHDVCMQCTMKYKNISTSKCTQTLSLNSISTARMYLKDSHSNLGRKNCPSVLIFSWHTGKKWSVECLSTINVFCATGTNYTRLHDPVSSDPLKRDATPEILPHLIIYVNNISHYGTFLK